MDTVEVCRLKARDCDISACAFIDEPYVGFTNRTTDERFTMRLDDFRRMVEAIEHHFA